MTTESHCDVLIVGGGLVGASLACALEGSGLSVAIIEAYPLNSQSQPCYDDRTVALSYGSRVIFESMGLWSLLEGRVEAIETIHISDRGHFGVTRLHHDEEGVEALGYVAENRVLGEVLYQRLEENKNVKLHCPAELTGIDQQADCVRVEYQEQGKACSLQAKLLVAADGVTSQVRELLQIGISKQDYRQSAVITNVTPGQSHKHVAYERFTDSGPLAFLPMTENRCSVVWTASAQQAEELVGLDDDEFLKRLQQRFGYRLGRLKKTGKRHVYPLALVEATQVVRGRVVVVGNAAHALHPVAGQGFNLALRDIALLAEMMVTGDDVGSKTMLQSYETMREKDAHRVYRFTDMLVKVFSNDISPLAHLRAAGLVVADLIPSVKHQLARQSMGLSGRMSRLARRLSIGANDV
jgi:2-octaprenyl-6-methoxyphenol hydroxylase